MSESLAAALRRTAARHGERPAVVGPDQTLSYAELRTRAERVAATLRQLGVAPGGRVGLLRSKNAETVALLYGILEAGCAYVPIDTRMGAERLAAVLADAELAALAVEPSFKPRLLELARMGLARWLDAAREAEGIFSFATLRPVPCEDDLAYILYTSGSTGRAKGVQHTHASAFAFADWAAAAFGLSPEDRLSCHAPLHFDLTTFDLFAALLTGAAVVLVPEDLALFPRQLAAWIEAEGITVWYSVPFALIELVLRGGLAGRRLRLREVIFAGERFPPGELRRLAAAVPAARLSNLFGPTETNVCTYHHLSSPDLASDELCPIGKACPYALTLIVDEDGSEVAAGESGELWVGGGSVMTGYLHRAELNARVFVTRRVGEASERFFRTGDLVSRDHQQVMRFHGRADRQVKVRGFRLELDEIEAELGGCPGVRAAAAWVERDERGFAELLAAVASQESEAPPRAEQLTERLRSRLPQAAVPSQILVLAELPRTGNGKIDYAALAQDARRRQPSAHEETP